VSVLVPFVGAERTAKYETFVLLADALRRTGDLAKAVELLERAIAWYGVNAALLNAVGESYEAWGKLKEALAAFERSLELSPDQPEVRKKVEELRRKKAG
jgi:tetratricopeptide (TPR) repeat protein